MWIYFPDLAQLTYLLPPMQLKLKKEGTIVIDTPMINSPLTIAIFGCLHK
jgi:hypothetical protein